MRIKERYLFPAIAFAVSAMLLVGCAALRDSSIDNVYLLSDASPVITPQPQITAAVVYPQNLLQSGDFSWRYLDTGQAEAIPADGQDWTLSSYDDSVWKTAAGSFGAKNGELAVMLDNREPDNLLTQYYPDSNVDLEAYYFRATFTVPDPKAFEILEAQVSYDDAIIVYLNGEEVYSGNVPDGGYDGNMCYGAADALGGPNTDVFDILADRLTAGQNTLAVEVHQQNKSSSDVYFDFCSLSAIAPEIVSTYIGVGADSESLCVSWKRNGRLQSEAVFTLSETLGNESQTLHAASWEPYENGYAYRTDVSGLKPETEYSYTIRCGGIVMYGDFQTGTVEDGVDVLLLGDPQLSQPEAEKFLDIWELQLPYISSDLDFTVCLGDVAVDADDEPVYRDVINSLRLTRLPTAMIIGNHDELAETLSDSINVPNHSSLGVTPSTGEMSGDYWFSYGNCLFLCLNSNEHDTAVHEAFLNAALEEYKSMHGEPQWRIVLMHHALFSQGNNIDRNDVVEMRETLSLVFSRLDIDLVIAGHDHTYSRSYLMQGTEPVRYTGTHAKKLPGEVLYLTLNSSTGSKFYDLMEDQPYTAFARQKYVAMQSSLHIGEETIKIVTWESKRENVIDEFSLMRAS